MKLWNTPAGERSDEVCINLYQPSEKLSDAAVIIFPGGGYSGRAEHEGRGYAEFLAACGISSFVVDYRVAPCRFPLPLADARRAVQLVRSRALDYGIRHDRIAVMGSSAGGHLAAMLCTYTDDIGVCPSDDISRESYLPDAQILCYPVICNPGEIVSHAGSYSNLLGDRLDELCRAVDPQLNVSDSTAPAFIWHTADDGGVNVINSYRYATALREHNVPAELHVFPHGRHGLGLAREEPHTAQWSALLLNWFKYLGWLG